MNKNLYYQVGKEVDYKRVVLEFDRYLKETKLLYAINPKAVMDDIRDTWKLIIAGEFVRMEDDEFNNTISTTNKED